jgi:KaiC/GvpD/RAD55 family RecA-like ATPase
MAIEISELKRINLSEFLARHYQVTVSNGKAHCPFHPPDEQPSFSVYQNGGEAWGWKDFHDNSGGSVLDFVARMEGVSLNDAIRRIKELEGLEGITQTRTSANLAQGAPGITANPPSTATQQIKQPKETRPERKIEKIYDYVDENGKLVFQKIRYIPKAFACRRPTGTNGSEWLYSLKGIQAVPYRLDKIKSEKLIYICEGEKDADLLASLGYASTSAPFGASSWPPEINKYFRDKVIYFLYDVGNDDKVQKIAAQLWEFTQKIAVLSLPLKQREADVSDYLASFKTDEEKKVAFGELINHRKKFEHKVNVQDGVFIGTVEEFMAADITKAEPLVDPLVFRGGFSAVGGVKGSHKSFFVTQLGLSLASGKPEFLNCPVLKPAKVVLVQQEISVGFLKERLERIKRGERYDTSGRFIPITTTGKQLKLLKDTDLDQIKRWLEKYEPDLLILDPISSFYDIEENASREMSRIRDVLNRLKSVHNLALLVTHHFSSKRNPNDPLAPTEVGGWFRGHSCLSDAADVLICLHRLPGQRENQGLSKNYEDYNQVQVQLRNGQWPERFSIEFDEDTFLLKVSDIWHELGQKIIPDQIYQLIFEHGGQMKRSEIITHFVNLGITSRAIKRTIERIISTGKVTVEELPGRGSPQLLKLGSGA